MQTFSIEKDFDKSIFKSLKGITVEGSVIHFDDSFTKESAERIMALGEPTKRITFNRPKTKALEMTDQVRGILMEMGVEEEVISELVVRRVKSAHNQIDRDRERFTNRLLDKFAQIINEEKSPFIFMHDARNMGILAKTFRAFTEPDPTDPSKVWLVQDIFIDTKATVPGTGQTVNRALQTKYFDHVSIGFNAPIEFVEAKNGEYIGIFDDTGEREVMFRETSFVDLGAQPGARVSKYFKSVGNATPKPQFKSLIAMNINFNEKSYSVTAEGEQIKGLTSLVEDAQKAIADAQAEAKTAKDANESLQKDNDAFRKHLTDRAEVLQGEKGLNLQGHQKRDAEELKSFGAEKLYTFVQDLEKAYADANPSGQTDNGKKTAENLSPFIK